MDDRYLLEARELINSPDNLDQAIKDSASDRFAEWFTNDDHKEDRPQLTHFIEQRNVELLVDSFYQVLPFGTGGRRGPVGIGCNRFNAHTLTSSIQGHVEYLRKQAAEKGWTEISVVIAYDVRQFNDMNRVYNPDLPNPCLGMSSKDFAHLAAGVYAGNGIQVWILPETEESYMSTPELSFLIRHYKAKGGLNVSASHNPPDDNGAKVYNYTGGQEVPPNDDEMVQLVEKVEAVKCIAYEEAKDVGLINFVDASAREGYISAVQAVSLQTDKRGANIVYSPLHGAGKGSVGRVLSEAGFKVIRVESQWENDGGFSNVPNHIANPEEPPSAIAAARLLKDAGADLAITTDPDADRMGAIVADLDGKVHFLDGNQLATILTYYVLDTKQKLKRLPEKPLIIKTEVTTSILTRIAEKRFNATCIDHLLVGFKYVGDILRQIEENGNFEGETYSLDDFVLGCEESHGYLTTPEIRDKDAACASILLSELAAACKAEGRTILSYLDDIYKQCGFTKNVLVSIIMRGAVGNKRIGIIMDSLRENPPTKVGDRDVVDVGDLQKTDCRFGELKSKTDEISRNFLLYTLDGKEDRLAVRPSGTEPKTKLYVECTGYLEENESLAELKARVGHQADSLGNQITELVLDRCGMTTSDPEVTIVGIEALEWKRDFDAYLESETSAQ